MLLSRVIKFHENRQLAASYFHSRFSKREYCRVCLLNTLLPWPYSPSTTGVAINRLFHIKAALIECRFSARQLQFLWFGTRTLDHYLKIR